MKNPTVLGAICGSTIGSVYEFNPTKAYNFDLLRDDMNYTDDSIMTIAVADWILQDPTLSHRCPSKRCDGTGKMSFVRWAATAAGMPLSRTR